MEIAFLIVVVLLFILTKIILNLYFNPIRNSPKKKTRSNNDYPERWEAIKFFENRINEAVKSGDIENANLNFAKLVESIRQQNINSKGKLSQFYENVQKEYSYFRSLYSLEYPQQFLPPSKRKKTK